MGRALPAAGSGCPAARSIGFPPTRLPVQLACPADRYRPLSRPPAQFPGRGLADPDRRRRGVYVTGLLPQYRTPPFYLARRIDPRGTHVHPPAAPSLSGSLAPRMERGLETELETAMAG